MASIILTNHAEERSNERESPLHAATAAVNRQMAVLDSKYNRRGQQVAVCYYDGTAIVERVNTSHVKIITVYDPLMKPRKGMPVIIDSEPRRYSACSIGAILAAKGITLS